MVEAGSSFHQEQGNSTLLGKITQNASMAVGTNFFEWFSMGSEHYVCSLYTPKASRFCRSAPSDWSWKKSTLRRKAYVVIFPLSNRRMGKVGPSVVVTQFFFWSQLNKGIAVRLPFLIVKNVFFVISRLVWCGALVTHLQSKNGRWDVRLYEWVKVREWILLVTVLMASINNLNLMQVATGS